VWGWVGVVGFRGLSEKRAPEMGGNKGGGNIVISYPRVAAAVEYGYLCWSNYATTHRLRVGYSAQAAQAHSSSPGTDTGGVCSLHAKNNP
jgi:hypothetical protein